MEEVPPRLRRRCRAMRAAMVDGGYPPREVRPLTLTPTLTLTLTLTRTRTQIRTRTLSFTPAR